MARLTSNLRRHALNAVRRLRRLQVARLDTEGNRIVLEVAGRQRYFELSQPFPAFETFDFAAFALAAISMRRAIPIRFDLPVSESAARAVAHLSTTMQQRAPTVLSPVDLELTTIVADRAPGDGGIMCLSGGVDSTHLALSLKGYTHGLTIQGFDFPVGGGTGFEGRRNRIGTIAQRAGLEVIDLKTNLAWSMRPFETLNVFYFASCLHLAGYGFGKGAFSGDLTAREMLTATCHGMVKGIDTHLSTAAFPISMRGWDESRGEKMAFIAQEAPELLGEVGFCFQTQDTGDNCGTCEKCMRTRFCLDYSGLEQTLVFPDWKDPVTFYESMPFKSNDHAARYIERLSTGIDLMPDGDQRNRLIRVCERARAEHLGVRHPRISQRFGNGDTA